MKERKYYIHLIGGTKFFYHGILPQELEYPTAVWVRFNKNLVYIRNITFIEMLGD